MNAEERREASRSFSEMLREKVARSREGLRLEDLARRSEEGTSPGGRNEPDEEEGRG